MALLQGTLVKMLGDGTFITLTSTGVYLGRTTLVSGFSRDFQALYLPTGEMITVDGIQLEFYDATLARINGIAAGQVYYWISSNLSNKFYYSVIQGITVQRIVTVNGDGSFVAFSDLATPSGGDGLGLLNDNFIFAVNPGGTLVYCSGSTKSNVTLDFGAYTIFKYTLATGVQGTNFTTYSYDIVIQDIKVLANGQVLVLVGNRNYTGLSQLMQVDRYNTSGVLQQSYQFNDIYAAGYSAGSLAIGFDALSFWIISSAFTGVALTSPTLTDFVVKQIEISSGNVLNQFVLPFLINVSPDNHYRNPFFIVPDVPILLGKLTLTKITNPVHDNTVFTFQAFGGLSPTTFQLSYGQSIVFDNLLPGVYRVVEEPNEGWIPTYNSSNGSFSDTITVGNGEIVTVTIINTISSRDNSGLYQIVLGKTSDTIYKLIAGLPPSEILVENTKIVNPFIVTSLIKDEDG